MKTGLKKLFGAVWAALVVFVFAFTASAGPGIPLNTAKAVLQDTGKTLRFVYDNTVYSGAKGTDWFLISDLADNPAADPPWFSAHSTVTKVVFDESFGNYHPGASDKWHCGSWFWNFPELVSVEGLKYLDVSNVKSMAYMFGQSPKLTQLDLSSFNTANCEDMRSMFYDCTGLKKIYVSSSFSVEHVGDGKDGSMFYGCSALEGALGTTVSSDSKTYARIDKAGEPGYFSGAPELIWNYMTGTMTFYADGENHSGHGRQSYSVLDNAALGPVVNPVWIEDVKEKVRKVVFHSSFATYDPPHCFGWFYDCEGLKSVEGLQYLDVSQASSLAFMFDGCEKLTELDLTKFKTAGVTDMRFMFANCSSLKRIYASSSFKTTGITTAAGKTGMFSGCTALEGFVSANVTSDYAYIGAGGYLSMPPVVVISNIGNMTFYADNVDHSGHGRTVYSVLDAGYVPTDEYPEWKAKAGIVTKVIFDASFAQYRPAHCAYWFSGFAKLADIVGMDKYLDTSAATSFRAMFHQCTKLTEIDVSNFDTSNCESTLGMFWGCSALEWLDLSSFDLSKVSDAEYMFTDCSSLDTIYATSKFNAQDVATSFDMFQGCTSLMGQNYTMVSSEGALTTKEYARIDREEAPGYFTAAPEAVFDSDAKTLTFYADGEDHAGTGKTVYSVLKADKQAPSANPLWYDARGVVAKVVFDDSFGRYWPRHCGNWFKNFTELTTIEGLSNLNTDVATSLTCMFYNCNRLELPEDFNLCTEACTDLSYMFYGCESLTKLDGIAFDTLQVTNMAGMFRGCNNLEELDLSWLHTPEVTAMYDMFYGCSSLKKLKLANFDTRKVEYMARMFLGCESLTELNLFSFDTSNVTDMRQMFIGCVKLKNIYASKAFSTAAVVYDDDMFYNDSSLPSYQSTNVDKTYAKYVEDGGYFTPPPVAVFDSAAKTLTFYADGHDHSGEGNVYSVVSVDEQPLNPLYMNIPWKDDAHATVTKVIFDASFVDHRPAHCANWFKDFSELTTIEGIKNLDTSGAVSLASMFSGCRNLLAIDLSDFNTYAATDMSSMFNDCRSLTELKFGNAFTTYKVTDMSDMFRDCRSLVSLNLERFSTDEVVKMSGMFRNCQSLEELNLYNFDTANVTDMNYMFMGCGDLQTLNVSCFDTSSVQSMYMMFKDCGALTALNLSSFDTSSVGNFQEMFYGDSSLETIYASSAFVAAPAAYGGGMFDDCYSLPDFDPAKTSHLQAYFGEGGYLTRTPVAVYDSNAKTLTFYADGYEHAGAGKTVYSAAQASEMGQLDEKPWYDIRANVVKVVFDASFADYRPASCGRWFREFSNLESIEGIENLDTSEVASFVEMFASCGKLATLDVSGFDTFSATNMNGMFEGCEALTGLDLSNFDTGNVVDMTSMFSGCAALVELDLSSFDTINVEYMSCMFAGCAALEELDVYSFDTGFVVDMWGMFSGCAKLATLNLYRFDTAAVEDMSYMFEGCTALAELLMDDNDFNTSAVLDMSYMFSGCSALGNLNLSFFHTANVFSMYGMFEGCSSLGLLDLSSFNTANVADMEGMFKGCTSLKWLDLTSFDTAKVNYMNHMMEGCTALEHIYASDFDRSSVSYDEDMFKDCALLPGFSSAKVDSAQAKSYATGGYFSRAPVAVYDNATKTLTFYADEIDHSGLGKTVYSVLQAGRQTPYDDPIWIDKKNDVTKVVFDASFAHFRPQHCGSWFWMFKNLSAFEGSENLNVSEAWSLDYMFGGCQSLTSLDVSGFNTGKTTGMLGMFDGCSALTALDLSNFDTSKVKFMTGMFEGCTALTSLDLTSFDTAMVTGMANMFKNDTALAKIEASAAFSTASVTDSGDMFLGCSALAGGNGTQYDVAKTDAEYARIDGLSDLPGYFTFKGDVTITFDGNGVTASPASKTVAYGSALGALPAVTWSGHEFLGWKVGGEIVTDASICKWMEDQTAVAQWDEVMYNITYVLDGGTNAAGNPATYTVTTPDIELAAPTRAGYTFSGWTPEGKIPAGSTGDKTFTANWTPVDPPPVDPTPVDPTPVDPTPVDPTPVDPTPVDPTPVGPTPIGPSPVGPSPVGPSPVGPSPVDPTPVVPTPVAPTSVVYTVTYNLGGGTNAAENPLTYTINSPEIVLAAPTRAGYTFTGWTPEGTIPAGSTGDKVFTANWMPVPPPGPTPEEISDPTSPDYDPTSPLFIPPELYQVKAATDFAGNVQYAGWVRDASGALKGAMLIKAGKAKKDFTSKLTVTYTPFGGKKQSIKNLTPVNPQVGGKPTVTIPQIGTVTLGDDSFASSDCWIEVGQDYTKSKDKAVKAAAIQKISSKQGTYVFALGLNGNYAGFSVKVDKKGKGKLAGTLPDGTKVSISSQGILGDQALAIPFVFAKKASFGLVFWVYDNGAIGISDLTQFKNAADQVQTLTWHGVSRTYELGSGTHVVSTTVGGISQMFTVAGAKWTFPKKDANPSGMKISFAAKTGAGKGSFTYVSAAGKVKYTVNGVVVGHTFYGTAYNKKVGAFPVIAE